MFIRQPIIIFILLCMVVVDAHAADNSKIIIHNPWIREAPPNAPVMAAYMIIENQTSKNQTLKSVTSDAFERVEIHMSMEKDGMAVMEKQDGLEIKPHGKLVMKPGGLHIMLIVPKKPYKAGDEVNLVLQFADGSENTIATKVVKRTGGHHRSSHADHANHGSHEKHDKNEHHHKH